MTPHTQQILNEPEIGQIGDCFRTCVACLLDVAPEIVPHVYFDGNCAEAIDRMNAWLEPRGLGIIEFAVPATQDLKQLYITGHFILSGTSPRNPKFLHSVIAKGNSFDVVHDPHPSRAGVLACEDAVPYYLINMIVRL